MSHHLLVQYLKEKVSITPQEELLISNSLTVKKFKKKEVVSDKGEVVKYLYFLNSGITRNYYINDKGKELTRIVTYKNSFFTNFLSFNRQIPSKEILECVEDAELVLIDRSKFYQIMSEIPKLKEVFLLVLIELHSLHLERLEELNVLSPIERFDELMLKNKELVFKLSNKVLASYLGVTQETCSRLKKTVF